MENEYTVAPGAKFKVVWRLTREESREFEGIYRGISAIGADTAMVFEVDGGLRFIASGSIACMDQLEAAPERSEKKKTDSGSVFYG